MAASDATPSPIKNTAFHLEFGLWLTTGLINSGAAGLDSEISKDGGAYADCTNEATEIGSSGTYYLDLTNTEMNADVVSIQTKSSTTNAMTCKTTIYTQSSGKIKVDVESVKTQAVTCGAGVTIRADVGAAAAPGASNGMLIGGSNAATTFAGLTTGALAATTITASGAVAFQSTFAVTTSTALAALSCSTFASSGTVTFNAFTITNGFTVSGTTTLTGAVTASNAANNIVGIDLTKISGDSGAADVLEAILDGTGAAMKLTTLAVTAGVTLTQASANQPAMTITGNGSGNGLTIAGGATGVGLAVAGLTGMTLTSSAGNALEITATGGDGVQIAATGGDGVQIVSVTVGKGLSITSIDAEAIALVGDGGITCAGDVTLTGSLAISGGLTVTDVVSMTNAANDIRGVRWLASWDAEVQSEVQDALEANNLDHLLKVAAVAGDVVDSSVVARMTSKSATPAFTSFVNTTDSLEAIKDSFAAITAPTVIEIDTQLTLSHGAGSWAVSGSGSGAYAATVTVTDGTSNLQNALVRVVEGINTFTATTNVSGNASFSLDAATYTVTVTKDGYSFTPTTRTVTGNQAGTLVSSNLVMSQNAVPAAPSGPNLCSVYGYLRSQSLGTVLSGVKLTARRIPDELAYAGGFLVGSYKEATSDVDGLVELELERTDVITPTGAKWKIECVDAGLRYVTTLTSSALNLATVLP